MRPYPLLVRILSPAFRVLWVVLVARRQFNLPRWVRGRRFTAVHDLVVAWLDGHFAVVERGAPWLRRIGADVHDRCSGAARSVFEFSLESGPRASVACHRDIIVVYGFDGDLGQRLGQLTEALSAAGWERSRPFSLLREREDASRHAWLTWEPSPAWGYPPGPDGIPLCGDRPLSPRMLLTWTSRGQTSRLRQDPNRRTIRTRNFLTVESSDTEYWKLPETALARHDHIATLTVSLAYYHLPGGRGVPRYLRPSRRRRLPPHGDRS